MTILRGETRDFIHQGAIYCYRPFFWLETPLWISRITSYDPQNRHAQLFTESQLPDAFRGEHIIEDVLVKAKRRFVIVISKNSEAQHSKYKDVLVAPFYSFDGKEDIERKREILPNVPFMFYIESDDSFPYMREGVLDLRGIILFKKDLLREENKMHFSLTNEAMRALLKRYWDYLSS
jgi:hypothetical protein